MNAKQTMRDHIKFLKHRAHRLPGGWSEFPLGKLLAHMLPCTRTILVLVQSARIGLIESQGIVLWGSVKVWKKSHLFVYKAFFLLRDWSLKKGHLELCQTQTSLPDSVASFQKPVETRSLCVGRQGEMFYPCSTCIPTMYLLPVVAVARQENRDLKFQLFGCVS